MFIVSYRILIVERGLYTPAYDPVIIAKFMLPDVTSGEDGGQKGMAVAR
ncbi:MAG: hypothetical protein M3M89_06510 [Thermoproteota archaeon]|nr:hypothetical protein [Thermoproteota archaeon]